MAILIQKESKLVLGTAQLGLPYGIANVNGKPSKTEAFSILKYAWVNDIRVFDTAPSYGNSETIIGEFIFKENIGNKSISIITKLPKWNSINDHQTFIGESVAKSLLSLNVPIIDYYLIHNVEDINKTTINILHKFIYNGFIKHLGASVYTKEEALKSIELGFNVLEIPVNLFDHRFISRSFLKTARDKNIVLIARSVYLQGLLSLNKGQLPNFIASAAKLLEKLSELARATNLSTAELALGFVKKINDLDYIIIGAESVSQIKDSIITMKYINISDQTYNTILDIFCDTPQHIIDPRGWKG